MTVWDLVAVVVTVCVIVTMTILLLLLTQLVAVLRDLRSSADRLANHALPAVEDLKETVDHADVELERLQGVIGAAEEISQNLRSVARKSARMTSAPFIKLKAIAAGCRSAINRMKND
jgi:methyl-accepting chemotaxis protein